MNNRSPLALKLKELRKSKGLTQEQVAEHTGVSLRTIQRLEADKVKPQLNTLCQLAQLFEITIEEFTTLEESKTSERKISKPELAIIHLSPLFIFLLPAGGNILGPVILWLWKRKESEVFDRQGIQLINFQISLSLYLVVLGVTCAAIFLFGPIDSTIIIGEKPDSSSYSATLLILGVVLILSIFSGFMLWNVFISPRRESAFYPFAIPFLKGNNRRTVQGIPTNS